MEHEIDFKVVVERFQTISAKAKSTLLKQMIDTLTPNMCRTVIRYACIRLDAVNSKFPKGHSGRERYETYHAMRKRNIKNKTEHDRGN